MAWRETVYEYDGSFEGLLCCVFESYVYKERPVAVIRGTSEPCLFPVRAVVTDREHARRVGRSLHRISPEVIPFLRRVFLTNLEEKELAVCRFVTRLYREGKPFLSRLADDDYQPLLRAVRRMMTEVEHLRGFLRFSDFDGVLGAEIEPENRVLPLLRRHFCERCHEESFFIYDRTHHEALLYAGGVSRIVPLDHFEMAPPGAEEAACRRLWRRFYEVIAIPERENPRLRASNMPKRYWHLMTEFQASE